MTLKMVAVDDKANPGKGVRIVQQLVDVGMVAVVGHPNFGVSILAAPIYAAKSIASLAISGNPKFTELGHVNAPRLVANDELQACAVGSLAGSPISDTKFAVIDNGTPYGNGLAEATADKLKTKNHCLTPNF